MTTYNVLLEDGTVGSVCDGALEGQHPEAFMGEFVNVHIHDENGSPVERQGRLVEVLGEARFTRRAARATCRSSRRGVAVSGLTLEQFEAVADLLRLRPFSTSYQVSRTVFVDGLSIGQAARHNETSYNAAHQAVKRVERGLKLARTATGS